MPVFDEATRDKIVELRGLRNLGTPIEGPYELIKVEWPSPDGTKYYSTTAIDEIASVAPPGIEIELRMIPDSEEPNRFVEVAIDSTIGDEEIDLKFWDNDDVVSDLVVAHGEGIRVTLLNWFPQVELLLPLWEGHLRAEDEGDVDTLMLKAVQGFRSSDASIPSRAHYSFCQRIFGGILETQEEIDEHGCNYNKHLGGSIGTLDPDTSQPWTFCPRREQSDCSARGISIGRHMSHKTMVVTTANNQSSGPRLMATSQGNETNLTEPLRVVMGTRRIHGMPVMAFVKAFNTNNPSQGFFHAFYEAGEGPNQSITQHRVNVGGVVSSSPTHFVARLGNVQDASPDNNITPFNYSSTSFIRFIFGPVDPAGVGPDEASASVVISGLRDIRTYQNVTAEMNGLLARFYTDDNFGSEYGSTVIFSCNWTFAMFPPFDMPVTPQTGFSIRMTGQVKPRYTETYTFEINHDNGVKLWVNNTVVIDQLASLGTHTGTIALTAETLYDIRIDFKQDANPAANPWYCIMRWWSASQAAEIVPYDRLFVAEEDTQTLQQSTSNRVWHIARMLCDKRWGNGFDYARLGIEESWIESADWVEDFVRFTGPDGRVWDHQRGMSDVELIERKVQQQIEDMCTAGRLSLPFLFDGKYHLIPLRALTEEELDECPEFTDEGESRNIIWEGDEGEEKSTLKWSRKSDLDLPNRIECTYDSAADDYKKTPLQPVEDVDAQLRAGRVIGDRSRKINIKKYHLLGVVGEAHAMKLAWSILDLGPLDDGGIANNLTLTFKIWYLDALDLHQFKVIKVTSSRLTKYGFTHFRIKKMERSSGLHYEITAQAYAHEYMETFETLLSEIPGAEEPDAPRPPADPPPVCVLEFGAITLADGILDIEVPACVIDDFTLYDLGVALTDGGIELTDGA